MGRRHPMDDGSLRRPAQRQPGTSPSLAQARRCTSRATTLLDRGLVHWEDPSRLKKDDDETAEARVWKRLHWQAAGFGSGLAA